MIRTERLPGQGASIRLKATRKDSALLTGSANPNNGEALAADSGQGQGLDANFVSNDARPG